MKVEGLKEAVERLQAEWERDRREGTGLAPRWREGDLKLVFECAAKLAASPHFDQVVNAYYQEGHLPGCLGRYGVHGCSCPILAKDNGAG